EFLDVEVPGLEIRADRPLAFSAVVRQTRRGHVRLVGIDLEIDYQRLYGDLLYRLDSRIDEIAVGDPITFGRRLYAKDGSNLRNNQRTNQIRTSRASERPWRARISRAVRLVITFGDFPRCWDTQPKHLVTNAFCKRLRSRLEVNLFSMIENSTTGNQSSP